MRDISLAGLRTIEAGTAKYSLDDMRLLRLADMLGIKPRALIRRADSLDAECSHAISNVLR